MSDRSRSTKAGSLSPATHERPAHGVNHHGVRSTKAGSLSPATLHALPFRVPSGSFAQRKPGAYPRRHASVRARPRWPWPSLNEGRELIPGDTRLERRVVLNGREALNEGRELIPGDTGSTPAARRRRQRTLNEGRELIPGDTRPALRPAGPGEQRSTKAGSLSPATRRPRRPRGFLDRRSTKAGSLSPATPRTRPLGHAAQEVAQRRPGAYPRRHHPSEANAAAFMLSAQRRPGAYPRRHSSTLPGEFEPLSLNEGRELIPGDTSYTLIRRSTPGATLNEGRELIPGDTARPIEGRLMSLIAQRRPGAYPRRHARNAASAADSAAHAQRRPGAYPRRHVSNGT